MSFEQPYCPTDEWLPADLRCVLDFVADLAWAASAKAATTENEIIRKVWLNLFVESDSVSKQMADKVLLEIVAARQGRPFKVCDFDYPSAHHAVLHFAEHPGVLPNPDWLAAKCKAETVRAANRRLKGLYLQRKSLPTAPAPQSSISRSDAEKGSRAMDFPTKGGHSVKSV